MERSPGLNLMIRFEALTKHECDGLQRIDAVEKSHEYTAKTQYRRC